MQVILPDINAPARFILDPSESLSDDDYFRLCAANRDLRIERNAKGDIILVPPAGDESDYRNMEVSTQLHQWAKLDGRGKVFGPSAEFILPNGAGYSPDACWVSNESLAKFSKEQRRKFLPLVPEFVIEVLSPSDRLNAVKEKMKEWIANGSQLGWLIDADNQTTYVFKPNQAAPETFVGVSKLAGEGPIEGFTIELDDVWAGL
jgi:Uma2 family endonuclease